MFDGLQEIEVGQLTENPQSSGGVALLLPGWIGYGLGYPSQFAPLVQFGYTDGVLKTRFREVYSMNYRGSHREYPHIAIEIRDVIEQLSAANPHERLTLLGVSYGAAELLYGLGQLDPKLFHNKRIILIDPPGGEGSLVKLNSYGRFGRRFAQTRLADLPEWLNTPLPRRIFNRLFCQGLADSDPIDVPRGVKNARRYIAEVRKNAFLGQQGFLPTLALEQIGVMANLHRDPAYLDACQHVHNQVPTLSVALLKVTIVTCTQNNQVIVPAVTKALYRHLIPSADFVDFPTNHTDFLQRSEFWNGALGEILN